MTHPTSDVYRAPAYSRRLLLSAWTIGAIDLVCTVAATALYYATLAHSHKMSDACDVEITMPAWCDVGFRVLIGISVFTLLLSLAGPLLRKRDGEITTMDAAMSILLRFVVTAATAIYVYLMFAAGAPHRIPCL